MNISSLGIPDFLIALPTASSLKYAYAVSIILYPVFNASNTAYSHYTGSGI